MKFKRFTQWIPVTVLALCVAGVGITLAACDRETSTSKDKSTKIVDTPDGKKVTETTETTTTKEKKDNP